MPSKKSRLQLYADECFPLTSVTYLRSQGISIIHAVERKTIRRKDEFHLKESKKLNRILITLDRDFLLYHWANLTNHPGIIIISVATATPPHINAVCTALLKHITPHFIKESVATVSKKKIARRKGEIIMTKNL